MSRSALSAAVWRKSSRSGQQGQCVEVAGLAGVIAIRDSKNPGSALVIERKAFRNLLTRLRG